MTRDELTNLLKNYKYERSTIADMLTQMAEECNAIFYPSDTGYDRDPIQKQFDQSNQIDLILSQCDEERRLIRQTLFDIRDKTKTLDALMHNLLKLNGLQRHIIMQTTMHDQTILSVSIELKRSEDTIKRQKQSGMDRLYYLMTQQTIRTE